LTPREAFRGFSDPAVVLIASMYVFGWSVNRWGIAEVLAQRLLGVGRRTKAPSENLLAARVTLASGLLSSVLSNTGIVATLIPVLSEISRKHLIPASRLMMPLAYGSLLGGLLTLVGTSTNLAIDGVLRDHGHAGLGLFDFVHLGAVLLFVGSLYFLWFGRLLLPSHRVDESLTEHYHVPQFVSEVLVQASSSLNGRTVGELDLLARHDLTVIGIVRGDGGALVVPGPHNRVSEGDVLVVQGEPQSLVTLRDELGLVERESVDVEGTRLFSSDVQLVEAVVPAGSSLVQRTLGQSDFRARTGLNVLAIAQHGHDRPGAMAERRLVVGDSLLIQGHRDDIARLRRSRQLIVLDEVLTRHLSSRAWITLAWLVAVLVAAGVGLLPLSVAALSGAVGLVLTGCVRPDEARGAVDWSVLVLVGGMLALGIAFQKHGLDVEVAGMLLNLCQGIESPHFLVGMFLCATVLFTQATSNVTAGVIMTPIALSVADALGRDPMALIIAVLSGASLAFMSPVAHQANAMVVGPGDYRFRDFVRVGTPLTVLLVAIEVVIVPLLWPMHHLV
jgi:di/tricarboxylate transporter